MTIEQLAAGRDWWPILKDIVRSEQVPFDRMAEIAREYPDAWTFCMENN